MKKSIRSNGLVLNGLNMAIKIPTFFISLHLCANIEILLRGLKMIQAGEWMMKRELWTLRPIILKTFSKHQMVEIQIIFLTMLMHA